MTNNKMAVADNEGSDRGRAILLYTCQLFAPSMVQASNNSLGIVFMNPVKMDTATGRVTDMFTIINPLNVLGRFKS